MSRLRSTPPHVDPLEGSIYTMGDWKRDVEKWGDEKGRSPIVTNKTPKQKKAFDPESPSTAKIGQSPGSSDPSSPLTTTAEYRNSRMARARSLSDQRSRPYGRDQAAPDSPDNDPRLLDEEWASQRSPLVCESGYHPIDRGLSRSPQAIADKFKGRHDVDDALRHREHRGSPGSPKSPDVDVDPRHRDGWIGNVNASPSGHGKNTDAKMGRNKLEKGEMDRAYNIIHARPPQSNDQPEDAWLGSAMTRPSQGKRRPATPQRVKEAREQFAALSYTPKNEEEALSPSKLDGWEGNASHDPKNAGVKVDLVARRRTDGIFDERHTAVGAGQPKHSKRALAGPGGTREEDEFRSSIKKIEQPPSLTGGERKWKGKAIVRRYDDPTAHQYRGHVDGDGASPHGGVFAPKYPTGGTTYAPPSGEAPAGFNPGREGAIQDGYKAADKLDETIFHPAHQRSHPGERQRDGIEKDGSMVPARRDAYNPQEGMFSETRNTFEHAGEATRSSVTSEGGAMVPARPDQGEYQAQEGIFAENRNVFEHAGKDTKSSLGYGMVPDQQRFEGDANAHLNAHRGKATKSSIRFGPTSPDSSPEQPAIAHVDGGRRKIGGQKTPDSTGAKRPEDGFYRSGFASGMTPRREAARDGKWTMRMT